MAFALYAKGGKIVLRQVSKYSDGIGEWTGRTVSWLIWVVMAFCVFEVIARRFFNAPHIWAYDVTAMFYAVHFMLLGGYTLLKQGHTSIDILSVRFSMKTQALLQIVTYLIFFFPFMIILFWTGSKYALSSWEIMERTSVGVMYVSPIMKTAVPIAALLLFLQGVSEMIRLVLFVKGDKFDD